MISNGTNFRISSPPKTYLCVLKKITTQLCSPIVFAIDIIKRKKNEIEPLPFISTTIVKLSVGAALGTFVSLPIGTAIVFSVSYLIGFEKFALLRKSDPPYAGKKLTYSTLITGAIVEEVVFRGIAQPILKEWFKFLAKPFYHDQTTKKIATASAIVFTATAFGLLHFANSRNPLVTLPQVINCIFFGIVYGIEKETVGLAVPMGDHIAGNAVAFFLEN
jgi:membrane protease YdiL (CAAX protease family)